MSNLQRCFNRFHKTIALDYSCSIKLKEKRAIIVRDLTTRLRKAFGYKCPKFKPFEQGSYRLGTGVNPLEGNDYDIDIGIIFDLSKHNSSAREVKKWVYDALDSLPRSVEYKRPCIRVQYHRNGEKDFHVDLAVYSNPKSENPFERTHYIAMGHIDADVEDAFWDVSQPFELVRKLENKFRAKDDSEQFRRVIKYLKRWKDYSFYSDDGKPTGIAVTACAYEFFQSRGESRFDSSLLTNKFVCDDLRATTNLVFRILDQFDFDNRIRINLPVEPFNNLFEKMDAEQMVGFKIKLENLKDALISAWLDKDIRDACDTLQKVFGGDFQSPFKYAKK